jgi:uncharacterized DUF497 family protein
MIEFDWDDGNIEHIADHRIEPDEVEEAFEDLHRIQARARNAEGEIRRAVIGRTAAGRFLYIVYTARGRLIRPVTAYDAPVYERRRYQRRGK